MTLSTQVHLKEKNMYIISFVLKLLTLLIGLVTHLVSKQEQLLLVCKLDHGLNVCTREHIAWNRRVTDYFYTNYL